ncbi:piggyBac transposable element-derived protein 4-like, partial [Vespula maculifrons]
LLRIIKIYKPDTNLTVDEHLFPTKIRCKFTRYKVYVTSDANSKYIIKSFSYLGKEKSRPLDEFVVLKLVSSIGCWRNITTDNFFTSASLATKLLAKRTTLLILYKSNNSTLTICKSKPIKKVIILSSKHKNVKIDKNKKRITETVAIVVLDGLLQWHVQIFLNIFDLADINAWILYKETNEQNIPKQQYLLQIAEEFAENYHGFLQEGKETVQSISSGQYNISHSRKTCQIRFCKNNKITKYCI